MRLFNGNSRILEIAPNSQTAICLSNRPLKRTCVAESVYVRELGNNESTKIKTRVGGHGTSCFTYILII
jgi:hypothetical protein